MLIKTVNFGDLEIPDGKIIDFREGLPGFPHIRKFTVLEFEDVKPFQYLQALGDPPIALLIINPFLIDPSYEFQLSTVEMEDIQSAQPGSTAVYTVATIPDNPEEATVNLMAPIIINESMRVGKQVILLDTKYTVRHPLFRKTDDTNAGSNRD
jgi:flagellar assembly factor FliW